MRYNYLLEKPIAEVKLILKRLKPEIVGITCGSATYSRCVETAKAVKETLPSCKVVVGGWHPSYEPESMLQHPEIDYVVMGEGERAMVELATYISEGESEGALTTALSAKSDSCGEQRAAPSVPPECWKKLSI